MFTIILLTFQAYLSPSPDWSIQLNLFAYSALLTPLPASACISIFQLSLMMLP